MLENLSSTLCRFFLSLGGLLIATGGIILIYLAIIVLQVIHNPEEVQIVQFILENIRFGDKAVYGSNNGKPFEIHLTEPIRLVLFVFLGVMILSGLAGVLKALISGGINIIMMCVGRRKIGVSGNKRRRSGNTGGGFGDASSGIGGGGNGGGSGD